MKKRRWRAFLALMVCVCMLVPMGSSAAVAGSAGYTAGSSLTSAQSGGDTTAGAEEKALQDGASGGNTDSGAKGTVQPVTFSSESDFSDGADSGSDGVSNASQENSGQGSDSREGGAQDSDVQSSSVSEDDSFQDGSGNDTAQAGGQNSSQSKSQTDGAQAGNQKEGQSSAQSGNQDNGAQTENQNGNVQSGSQNNDTQTGNQNGNVQTGSQDNDAQGDNQNSGSQGNTPADNSSGTGDQPSDQSGNTQGSGDDNFVDMIPVEGDEDAKTSPEESDNIIVDDGSTDDLFTSGDLADETPADALAGQSLHFVDMAALTDLGSAVQQVNVAFLKADHSSAETGLQVPGADGTLTAMTAENGIYTAAFPEDVSLYSEAAFQVILQDGSTHWLQRHYHFRGQENAENGFLPAAVFTYQSGVQDTVFYNNAGEAMSYVGALPKGETSLDGKILAFNTGDLNGDGAAPDENNIWIKWNGMPQSEESSSFSAEKGYKANLRTADQELSAFAFPADCGATDRTVLTVTWTMKDQTEEKNFHIIYSFADGTNCVNLDNIGDASKPAFAAAEIGELTEAAVPASSDGSLYGETMRFINLYWETQDLGSVQAVFDGGTQDAVTQEMTKGDRGAYTTEIPEGDHSRVTFVNAETGENLGENSWNYYGQETEQKNTETVDFQPVLKDTFYYDMGGNPSYWGADPDYEDDGTSVQTMALAANAAEGSNAAAKIAPGEMIYFTDLHGLNGTVEDPNEKIKRVHIAFLKTGHAEPPVLTKDPDQPDKEMDGEVYTMYEKRDGLYTAPLPESIEKYSEVTFQLVRDKDEPDGGVFARHYNFRGVTADNSEKLGTFTYAPGTMDAFFYNTNELDSYWGEHPSKADMSLDTKVLYFNTKDLNGNETQADIENIWIKWANMPEKQTGYDKDDYDEEKGLHISKLLLGDDEAGYRYYQFPFNSNATENTVITITYGLKKTDGTKLEGMNTFLMLYPVRNGMNCLEMDNIQESSGNVFGVYEIPEDTEKRDIIIDNSVTAFDEIQARVAVRNPDGSFHFPAKDELKKNGFELAEGETEDDVYVEDDGTLWIKLKQTPKDDVDENEHDKTNFLTAWGKRGIPEMYNYVQFRGRVEGKDYYYSPYEKLPEDIAYPCFYPVITGEISKEVQGTEAGGPLEKKLEDGEEPEDGQKKEAGIAGMTGYWDSVYNVNNYGDESIDIPTGTFVKDPDAYYVDTNFYDYYSDWEMTGRKRKDAPETLSGQTYLMRMINTAAAQYYQDKLKASGRDNDLKTYKPFYLTDQSGNDQRMQDMSGALLWNTKIAGDVNNWTKDDGPPVTGIAGTQLTDGNITIGGIENPFFNEAFLRGANTLGTAVGNVYKNVLFPFKINTDKDSRTYGYWEYDSSKVENTVRLKYDVDNGYYLEKTGQNMTAQSGLNAYLPYSGIETLPNGAETNYNTQGKVNFLFGNRFDIDFQLTNDKTVTAYEGQKGADKNGKVPIKFEFQGDDDVWIYIVDEQGKSQLVLDLGGIHDAVRGTINFANGEVEVRKGLISSLAGGHKEYGGDGTLVETTTNVKDYIQSLKPGKKYTMRIFYMERACAESNLKITFNFPKQNTFSVTKNVDLKSGVQEGTDDIFSDVLSYISGFSFKLKNLVTSGKEVEVKDSAGYVEPGDSIDFYKSSGGKGKATFANGKGTTVPVEDGSLLVTQKDRLSGQIPDTDSLLKVTNAVADLSSKNYLRMEIKNMSNDNAASGMDLYIAFMDSAGNCVGGYANTLTYNNESVYFRKGESVIMRIDFSKAAYVKGNIDWSKITTVLLGLRHGGQFALTSMDFYSEMNPVESVGFGVGDDQISDYGSYNSGVLSEVDDAWYVKTNGNAGETQGVSYKTDAGNFSLGNGQTATFTDKFRIGSYIALSEDVDSDIFDTTWSIKENGQDVDANSLLSARDDVSTVINPHNMIKDTETPLKDRTGTTPGDGRQAVLGDEFKKAKPNFKHPDDLSKTIVYRSYADPDESVSTSVNLSVDVANTLKRGSIKITKKLAESMKKPGTDEYRPGTYTFDIYYTNIAGMGLEMNLPAVQQNERYIHQVVEVYVDESGTGSETVYNIPAGTEYYIRERPANGAVLTNLKVVPQGELKDGQKPHKDVKILDANGNDITEGAAEELYKDCHVVGTAYNSCQEFEFTNENEPFFMDLKKEWKDGLPDEEHPEVHIQIQRRIVGEDDNAWKNVTQTFFGDSVGESEEDSYIVFNHIKGWSTKAAKALEVRVSDDPNSDDYMKSYEYRIQELNVGTGVLANYQVSYDVTWDKPGENDTRHVVYKAINTAVGMAIRKEWDDNNNSDGIRPEKIRVRFQRSSNYDPKNPNQKADWEYCKKDGTVVEKDSKESWIVLTKENNWGISIPSLPQRDNTAERHTLYYRIAEEQIWISDQNGESGKWVSPEKESEEIPEFAQPTYSAPIAPSSNASAVLLVKNVVKRGQVKLIKYETNSTTLLKGAEFKIEKLIPGDKNQEKNWKVDDSWKPVTKTTGDNGELSFDKLPYGSYRITETKAPSGYVLLKNPIHVTISDQAFKDQAEDHKGDVTYDPDSKTITVKAYNEKGLSLPSTGFGGILGFTLAGIAVLGVGMLLYIWRIRTIRRARRRR